MKKHKYTIYISNGVGLTAVVLETNRPNLAADLAAADAEGRKGFYWEEEEESGEMVSSYLSVASTALLTKNTTPAEPAAPEVKS